MELNELYLKLQELPDQIAKQRETVEGKRFELEKEILKCEVAYASSYLANKEGEGKKTVAEIEALTIIATEKDEAERILKEGEYKSELLKLENLVDQFVAVRKIGSLMESEMKVGLLDGTIS